MSEAELQHACEFIKNRLYWVSLRTAPRQTSREHFFTTDNELVYWNFFLGTSSFFVPQPPRLHAMSVLLPHTETLRS